MTSSRQTPFQLPGWSLPLNWTPHPAFTKYSVDGQGGTSTKEYPAQGGGLRIYYTALNRDHITSGYTMLPLTTLREFTMLQLMNQLTDKPDWDKKIFDESIISKWREEALSLRDQGVDITEKMVDWCVDELQWRAENFRKTGHVFVFSGDVVKSDSAVSTTIKEALKAAVAPLENVPPVARDYHPGSDEKVLDLVHPSLFPLVYGRSRILPDRVMGVEDCLQHCGEGETITIPPEEESKMPVSDISSYGWQRPVRGVTSVDPYSLKFQWLPCDVKIVRSESASGTTPGKEYAEQDPTSFTDVRCQITSYINNLHPHQHKDLYQVIEEVIACAIPLWNSTLTPQKPGIHLRRGFTRIKYDYTEYEQEKDDHPDKPEQAEDETDDDYWERLEQWWQQAKRLVFPEPGDFKEALSERLENQNSVPNFAVDLGKECEESGLQVIVKLANIELTPEKPEYDGGTWHVEGQMNEHICATALYYYDSANITESKLAFRQTSSNDDADEITYEQQDHDWLTEIFGCENYASTVQNVGEVVCKEGRLITFPNVLQHKVQPFRLQDPTKPGHRKILALFLVDPHMRVISTANVPPQQRHWWGDEIRTSGVMSKLPEELQQEVINGVEDFPIGMDEAKKLRAELMEERSKALVYQDACFKEHEFSLCEH